jgi:hypothetical protein
MTDHPNTPEMMRATLKRLVEQHGETYAALSRMIRRPDGYLAHFVQQGSPRLLRPVEADLLAGYFGIDPRLLGGRRSITPQSVKLTRWRPWWRR